MKSFVEVVRFSLEVDYVVAIKINQDPLEKLSGKFR